MSEFMRSAKRLYEDTIDREKYNFYTRKEFDTKYLR